MRMLLTVKIPNRAFSAALRQGNVSSDMERIIQDANPEAVYFTEQSGYRSVIMVVDVENPSQVPAYAEPWFLRYDAEVEFHVAMTPEDLKNSNLEKISKKWMTGDYATSVPTTAVG